MRVLPKDLRGKLKEPIGQLVNENELLELLRYDEFIVSVGDLVTFTLIKNGITPKIAIVDYVTERKKIPEDRGKKISMFGNVHIKIKNPKGTLTDDLWNAVDRAYKNIDDGPFLIEIEGEEDLGSLVAIYLAPSYATIIYGLPNKGVLVVKATEEHKSKVKEILDKM